MGELIEKKFNYYSILLLIGGVAGAIDTVLFWVALDKNVDFDIVYYSFNSLLVIVSAIKLMELKRSGFILFKITLASVFISLLIPGYLDNLIYPINNLFLSTILISIASWSDYHFAPIGMVLFLGGIFLNLSVIKEWKRLAVN
ncbi:MAG: hypothetical protein AAB657_04610 [Patescibacteria group bacterium]